MIPRACEKGFSKDGRSPTAVFARSALAHDPLARRSRRIQRSPFSQAGRVRDVPSRPSNDYQPKGHSNSADSNNIAEGNSLAHAVLPVYMIQALVSDESIPLAIEPMSRPVTA